MGKKVRPKRSPAQSANGKGQAEQHGREQYVEVHAPEACAGLDRHLLYQDAVQSPKGDISYLLSFYRQYIGNKVSAIITSRASSSLHAQCLFEK